MPQRNLQHMGRHTVIMHWCKPQQLTGFAALADKFLNCMHGAISASVHADCARRLGTQTCSCLKGDMYTRALPFTQHIYGCASLAIADVAAGKVL